MTSMATPAMGAMSRHRTFCRSERFDNGIVNVICVCAFLVGGGWSPALGVDCNRNNREDGRDIQLGASEDCNGNAVPDECEAIPIDLVSLQGPLATTNPPVALATGDLDGDGDKDFVTANRQGSSFSVSVFTRDSEGDLVHERDIRMAQKVYSVTVEDVDRDGDGDLVTSNIEVLLVFLNRGARTFDQPKIYPTSGDSRFAMTTDLDGDGAPEIVAANRGTTTISVYPNTGDGTFGDFITYEGGDNPDSVTVGDFDGDGIRDLATVNTDSKDFSVFLNSGDGSLRAASHYPAGGSRPSAVTAGDVNGDGHLDLLATSGTKVVVLPGRGAEGFAAVVAYQLPGPVRAFVPGDLDRDGDLDLIAGTSGGGGETRTQLLVVMTNDGTGVLSRSFDFIVPGTISALVTGDFDGDRDFDVVATTNPPATVIAFTNGAGVNLPVAIEDIRMEDCGQDRCEPHSVRALDFDGDGDVDIVGSNPRRRPALLILLNDGSGNFEDRRAHIFGTGEIPLALGMDAGDLDLDGDIDIVSIDHVGLQLWVHENAGDGTLLDNVRYAYRGAGGGFFIRLVDFDGDGDLDVAIANRTSNSVSVSFNLETSRRPSLGGRVFVNTSRDVYRVGRDPTALAAADFDGDGDVDIGVVSDRVSVLLNDGNGRFEVNGYSVTTNPNHLAVGDLDEDGNLDVLTANLKSTSLSFLRGLGDGTLSNEVEFPLVEAPFSVELVDYNGDRHLDAVTANEFSGTVSVLLGRGDGTFGVRTSYPVGEGLRWVVPADYDSDGDIDIVSANRATATFTKITNLASLTDSPYLSSVCTPLDFQHFSAPASVNSPYDRFLKYVLPARDDPELLPAVYQNSLRFELHFEFLRQVFPERFGTFSTEDYIRLVERRATRQYFVGVLSRFLTEEEGLLYGFSFFARFDDDNERPTAVEAKEVYDRLKESFRLEPLVYVPNSPNAREAAEAWSAEDPGFPIYLAGGSTVEFPFEAYTGGVGYGRVRIMTKEEFEEADNKGEFSFQDGLILERAPRDIQGVVGFVFTAEVQGELSHLAIRTNRRGTPNAFVRDAIEELAPWDGKLVRVEVTGTGYEIREAAQEEAEEFWQESRPSLAVLPAVDATFGGFPTFGEIATMEAEGSSIVSRVGGKASNLARLQEILTDGWSEYREKGFAIPVRYSIEFLQSNRLPSALDPDREVTYEEYLGELFVDSDFQTNPAFRFEALDALRDHMRDEGVVDPELVQSIAARVAEVMGTPSTTRVRFRSSSNVEDDIQFNGAGLYDSTSGCPEDTLDEDDVGPSQCDPTRQNERDITRALKQVWRSLWRFGAFEEREFYQIPQDLAAMGVVVNRTFIDEAANGVAFTGNPQNPFDRRYVITVQRGEESVVSPNAGVVPEKNVLEIAGGEVVNIIRVVPSSLVPPGTFVLSDDQLEELGRLMAHIDATLPVETGEFDRSQVLLDMEFKFMQDGELAVKQVRPFLLSTSLPPPPTFELEIPPDTVACGVFTQGRGNRMEYALKCQVRFVEGVLLLPSGNEVFSADLFEEVLLTQERRVATPVDSGVFRVLQRSVGTADQWEVTYHFDFEQEFTLPDGEHVVLTFEDLEFVTSSDEELDVRRLLDAEYLAESLRLSTTLPEGIELAGLGDPANDGGLIDIAFGSCTYETFPIWEVRAELEDGSSLFLEERYNQPEFIVDLSPAALTRADVFLGGQRVEVADYWNLCYTAQRHNTNLEYWVVFDPPLSVRDVEKPVRAVELIAPNAPAIVESARYLGEEFEILKELQVSSYQRVSPGFGSATSLFRRGDVDAGGDVTITDAVALLRYLLERASPPPCLKAADVNDSGDFSVTDAIEILHYLFRGEAALHGPFSLCGRDATVDRLTCESFPPCE